MKRGEEIKIEGVQGTWIVITKSQIKDMHGKVKTVYALEHSFHGDNVKPLFVDYKKRVIEELQDYWLLDDVEEDMKYNEWKN